MAILISCTILNRAVETAATQTKPAYAGFKALDFPPVRAGGLRFYSREFHSPGLVAQTLIPVPRLALDGMLFEVDAVAVIST